MRPAARLLLIEAEALRPILLEADAASFDRETVCTGWSVRDVLAHCAAALSLTASGELHDFTPDDNERDVRERRIWSLEAVLDELFRGYRDAAAAIDAAGGALDGIGLGEWIHGGDVREALEVGVPYAGEGIDLAIDLLFERSRLGKRRPMDVELGFGVRRFGVGEEPVGRAGADPATFVRLCGGRPADSRRYTLEGCTEADFVLFT